MILKISQQINKTLFLIQTKYGIITKQAKFKASQK